MSTIIQNAVAGQRKAMKYLYESNRNKLCYIAQNLLWDKTQGEKAVEVFLKMRLKG